MAILTKKKKKNAGKALGKHSTHTLRLLGWAASVCQSDPACRYVAAQMSHLKRYPFALTDAPKGTLPKKEDLELPSL